MAPFLKKDNEERGLKGLEKFKVICRNDCTYSILFPLKYISYYWCT